MLALTLVPFDASRAAQDERLTGAVERGRLADCLSQAFRAIIHSRMKWHGKYRREFHADACYSARPPGRRHVFASIFSYSQRRLCATAYEKLARISSRADFLAPQPDDMAYRCGAASRRPHRGVDGASDRVRCIATGINVRRTARDLTHALNALERWLDGSKAGSSSPA